MRLPAPFLTVAALVVAAPVATLSERGAWSIVLIAASASYLLAQLPIVPRQILSRISRQPYNSNFLEFLAGGLYYVSLFGAMQSIIVALILASNKEAIALSLYGNVATLILLIHDKNLLRAIAMSMIRVIVHSLKSSNIFKAFCLTAWTALLDTMISMIAVNRAARASTEPNLFSHMRNRFFSPMGLGSFIVSLLSFCQGRGPEEDARTLSFCVIFMVHTMTDNACARFLSLMGATLQMNVHQEFTFRTCAGWGVQSIGLVYGFFRPREQNEPNEPRVAVQNVVRGLQPRAGAAAGA